MKICRTGSLHFVSSNKTAAPQLSCARIANLELRSATGKFDKHPSKRSACRDHNRWAEASNPQAASIFWTSPKCRISGRANVRHRLIVSRCWLCEASVQISRSINCENTRIAFMGVRISFVTCWQRNEDSGLVAEFSATIGDLQNFS